MHDPPATAAEVESARREWEEGHRRYQDAYRDGAAGDALMTQVEVVIEELRRRVGGTYTLAELAGTYGRAESWSRAAVSERAAAPGWPRSLATVEAAAFHLYSRGAADYEP